MNIDYNSFERHLKNTVRVFKFQEKIDSVTNDFNESSKEEAEFRFPALVDDVVELLETATNDVHNWISYWLFELNCGEKYKDGMVTSGDDGSIIKLKTIEDLWNLLTSCEE